MKYALILLAGGQGTRMGEEIPKTFLPLLNQPLIQYSYNAFQKISLLSEIVVVCPPSHRSIFPSNTLFANPGLLRQDSVKNGLDTLSRTSDYVLIHDGARPLISEKEILHLISEGSTYPAAALASPITSTLKKTNKKNEVIGTPTRENLWAVHTPQMARYELLKEAFSRLKPGVEVTDDLSLIESLGYQPKLIKSHAPNIKVTYPEDLLLVEKLLAHD